VAEDVAHTDGVPDAESGAVTDLDLERTPLGVVEVTTGPAATLVRLSGEVDLSLSDELSRAYQLCRTRERPVRVDASGLTFIDSTGIGFVARLAAAEQMAGRRLQVIGASRRTSETLSLTGLDDLLEISY
jgi:anti-sigma B factor antagonist